MKRIQRDQGESLQTRHRNLVSLLPTSVALAKAGNCLSHFPQLMVIISQEYEVKLLQDNLFVVTCACIGIALVSSPGSRVAVKIENPPSLAAVRYSGLQSLLPNDLHHEG